jgi:hypothetical protein
MKLFDPAKGFLKVGKDIDGIYNVDYKDFAPHVGAAWDIFGNGKTALRAGYSLTYDVANFGALADPYNFARASTGVFTQANLGFFNVTNASLNGTPGSDGVLPTDPSSTCFNPDPAVRAGSTSASMLQPTDRCSELPHRRRSAASTRSQLSQSQTPRAQISTSASRGNCSEQRNVTVSYSGQRGRDLIIYYDQNASPIGSIFHDPITDEDRVCATAEECDPKRPLTSKFTDPVTGNPLIRHLITMTNQGTSKYDSLQVSYNQRGWHGLDTQYNLTWSKCFDLNSVNRGGQGNYPQINNNDPVDSTELAHPNFQDGHGLCDQDVHLNFNLGGVCELPDIPHLGSGWKGWQMSISMALSGHAFSVFRPTSAIHPGRVTGSAIRGSPTRSDRHPRGSRPLRLDNFGPDDELSEIRRATRAWSRIEPWDILLPRARKLAAMSIAQEVYNV